MERQWSVTKLNSCRGEDISLATGGKGWGGMKERDLHENRVKKRGAKGFCSHHNQRSGGIRFMKKERNEGRLYRGLEFTGVNYF